MFSVHQPPGTYECQGGELTMNVPKFTFKCKGQNAGMGPDFVYEPHKAATTS